MKVKYRYTYMIAVIAVFLAFCIRSLPVVSAEPINAQKSGDGPYIGRSIEYLNEGELFNVINKKWNVKSQFVEKMLSGQLHSDGRIAFHFEDVETGYRACMKEAGSSDPVQCVEWGIYDVADNIVIKHFIRSNSEVPLFDYHPHAYWLRFVIANPKDKVMRIYLECDKHFSPRFDLYCPVPTGYKKVSSNILQTFHEREIQYKNPVFPLELNPGISVFYARLDTQWWFDNVPLRLWSPENFSKHVYNDTLLQGIIIGIFLLLFFYNIFILISFRNKRFVYFALLIISQLVIHLCFSGFGFQYLWPETPVFGYTVLWITMPLQYICNIYFCRSFINIERYSQPIDLVMRILVYIFFASIAAFFLVPYTVKPFIAAAIILADYFYYIPLLVLCFIVIKRGDRAGVFLLMGLIVYFIAQMEWIITSLNIIPYNLINYLQIKGISYIVLLTAGLTYKIRMMEKSLADLNSNLEYRINERIEQLAGSQRKNNEKAVTDTTRIKIETVKEYLSENYSCDISREGLAAAVDMSPDHLGRMFKQYTGERMSDFINSLRISDASKMLLESDDKIIDIAFSVGFESLRTFNVVFAKIMMMNPSDYRKANKK